MKPRVTLTLALVAALLGGAYWYWEIKSKPARDEAVEDAKRVFPGKQSQGSAEILLRATGKAEVLLRKIDGAWNLITPTVALADPDAMKALLEQLDDVKKDLAVEEKAADLRKYGLDQPSGAVTFKPASPGAKASVLFFGADSFDGKMAYAMVDGQPDVFLTRLIAKTSLLKDADGLREKHLLAFDPEQVSSVRSSLKGGFSLEHDAQGQWQVRAGSQVEPADHDRVKAWLIALKEIHGESVVAEKAPKAAKYGLGGGPRLTVELKGKTTLGLIKGSLRDKAPAAAKDKFSQNKVPAFYAQVAGQAQVWSVPGHSAEALDKEARALMDLRAFAIKPGLVERLVVWQPGLTLTARRTDLKWAWDPPYVPKPGQAAFDFDDFVTKAAGTERLSRLPDKVMPAKPQMTVAFYGSGDILFDQAFIGPKQGAGQLAQSAVKHFVMIIAGNVFDGLPKPDKK